MFYRIDTDRTEGQRLQLFGYQHSTSEHLRQQPAVIARQQREYRIEAADAQLAAAQTRFCGGYEFSVFIFYIAPRVVRQQA
ncbi:hypothetical protein D3C78_1151310 [compost metagenome]